MRSVSAQSATFAASGPIESSVNESGEASHERYKNRQKLKVLRRLSRGLVARQTGQEEQGDAWLREGVELAGGGAASTLTLRRASN